MKYLSAWKEKNDFVIRNLGDLFVQKRKIETWKWFNAKRDNPGQSEIIEYNIGRDQVICNFIST